MKACAPPFAPEVEVLERAYLVGGHAPAPLIEAAEVPASGADALLAAALVERGRLRRVDGPPSSLREQEAEARARLAGPEVFAGSLEDARRLDVVPRRADTVLMEQT